MSNYHTDSLARADIFTIMGSIYAEVARYDSAVGAGRLEQASQAAARAREIIDFAGSLPQVSDGQKQELKVFETVLAKQTSAVNKSGLDGYLLPFAVAARRRQFA